MPDDPARFFPHTPHTASLAVEIGETRYLRWGATAVVQERDPIRDSGQGLPVMVDLGHTQERRLIAARDLLTAEEYVTYIRAKAAHLHWRATGARTRADSDDVEAARLEGIADTLDPAE